MEHSQKKEDSTKMLKDMMKAGQLLSETYFHNLPNLIHSAQDIMGVMQSYISTAASKPETLFKIQNAYINFYKKQTELWQQINQHLQDGNQPLSNDDKRFKSPEWNESPYYFYFIKQTYLMVSELINEIIEESTIEAPTKKKLKFYSQLYIDALSPANFLATNPEVLKLAQQTNGESLITGFKNLLGDIEQGKISQTDFSQFEVGKNIATTKGSVVFQNELIQLIQYKPLTEKISANPLFIISPWINRYYILDLEPENSFVRFAVEHGFTVFMTSWKVPKGEMGKLTLDDYAQKGLLDAIDAIREITGAKKVNALGYCIGGTLLGAVAAVLAAKRKNYLGTITLLATMLDFSDFGQLSAIVDMPLVEKLEKEIGEDGILKGTDMTNAFNMIRANNLIWNYVVNNYLMGKEPPLSSILHWTNDNTNLPGKMYTYYLRHIILENGLSKKNALKICNTQVDIGKIKTPCYVVGTAKDHISPCNTCFTTTHLVGGEVEFILGESGHVAGIINPPNNGNYGYYCGGELGKDMAHFRNTAKHYNETWWLHWAKWLKEHSGEQINAPSKSGGGKYKVIEPAPGSYVKEKM